ncbi:MAG: non-canonical purine NTP pyrophosphatase [Patescibacteria group bacterium]
MTQLYFVTSNANKFVEVQAILPGIKQLDADVSEIQSLDPRRIIEQKLAEVLRGREGGFIMSARNPRAFKREDGGRIANESAEPTPLISNPPRYHASQGVVGFIVEDTSLSLHCLKGLPGPFIKWFLEALGAAGIARLAKALDDPAAEARTMIGYAKNPQEVHFFEGVLRGSIVEPRGETTFGWDPIFVPEGHTQTFAEMSRDKKNSLSMRRKAVEQLRQFLAQEAG